MGENAKTLKKIEPRVVSPEAPQMPSGEVEMLIARAIDKSVPVENLERLLAMRRELNAERAKREFDQAMAAFQSECPTIKKTKEVKTRAGVVAYRYAPIDSIVEQVRKQLKKNGFSYSTNMELLPTGVKVSVKVTHQAGHSEITEMSVPLGTKTDIMSQSQVVAAAQTFAKRYAFCNAFGILTGDEDNDGDTQTLAPKAQAPEKPAASSPAKPSSSPAVQGISYAQQSKIFALLSEKKKTKADLDAYINARFSKGSITKLTSAEASATIKKLVGMTVNAHETVGDFESADNVPGVQQIDADQIADDAAAALG